ncbi:hypothetical protein J6590_066627 [Homalodisca vitripennis]|nr:hypothetical protein J6590_066627 [Homalodisca vitripennis]
MEWQMVKSSEPVHEPNNKSSDRVHELDVKSSEAHELDIKSSERTPESDIVIRDNTRTLK